MMPYCDMEINQLVSETKPGVLLKRTDKGMT